MDDSLPAFDELLRSARREAGLTQEELAERAGLSARAISNLERGVNRAPHRYTLDLLAKALDLPLDVRRQWEQHRSRQAMRSPRQYRPDGTEQTPPSQLPVHLSSFLGRDGEIRDIIEILETPSARMLTLTGPGGIGKTRLSTAVAEQLHPSFSDGVYFVPLVSVAQSDLVVHTLVQAMQLHEHASQTPEQALLNFLRDRSVLLVLDNFEHVLPAASIVATLLEECPGLTILATSRTPLQLRGERLYPLLPLADDASATLFIQRSRGGNRSPDPGEQVMEAVREICRRLDGLPLAIELAAARTNILTPHALLDRLEHPLTLLTSGPRDLPARQRTLRATIDWSYQLLQSDEQALLQALSVFRGGWTLEAVEYVCADNMDALSSLSALVDSSMVELVPLEGGDPRYGMLETIREFGLEQLEASGNEPDVRNTHAHFFATLVASAPPFLLGPDQAEWLNRFEQEHANVRDALDELVTHDVATGMSMLTGLWRFWWMRGHLTVGLHYFNMYLEHVDDSTDPLIAAQVLTGAGVMAEFATDFEWDRAEALHHEALSRWLDIGSAPEGAFWSYLCLGNIALRRADLNRARAFYDEAVAYADRNNQTLGKLGGFLLIGNLYAFAHNYSEAEHYFNLSLTIARAIGDPWTTSMNTHNLGQIYLSQGRYELARPMMEEALAVCRQLGHHRDIATSLVAFGWIELFQGNVEESVALFNEGYDVALYSGDTRPLAQSLYGLSSVALARKDAGQALDLCRQTLTRYQAAGDPVGIANALESLAGAYMLAEDFDHATLLYASATTYRKKHDIPTDGFVLLDAETQVTILRRTLPEPRFNAAWEAGTSLTPEQIVADEQAGARS